MGRGCGVNKVIESQEIYLLAGKWLFPPSINPWIIIVLAFSSNNEIFPVLSQEKCVTLLPVNKLFKLFII